MYQLLHATNYNNNQLQLRIFQLIRLYTLLGDTHVLVNRPVSLVPFPLPILNEISALLRCMQVATNLHEFSESAQPI